MKIIPIGAPKRSILKLTKPTLVHTCLIGQPVTQSPQYSEAARSARFLAEKLRAFAPCFYDQDPTVQNVRGFFCLFSKVLELQTFRSRLLVSRSSLPG
ncbi:hypothetical protein VNO77_00871 [Canavalia gladiata]|uniref:Uncharacterized protein n=1 Tax=Canavalia gladiata TaxID=3824 RepID=A0AAN9MQ92_CANGL